MGNNTSNSNVPENQQLLLDAVKKKDVENALKQINNGTNINYIYKSQDGETNTLLLTSIILNDDQTVDLLLKKNVDVTFKDDLGWNALLYSCWEKHVSDKIATSIIQYTIQKGYSYICTAPTPLGYTPLHFACWQGKCEAVEMLLNETNVNPDAPANGDYGVLLTPLNFACRYPQYSIEEDHPDHRNELRRRRTIILNLINKRVNLDVIDQTRDGEGFTPLLQALRCTGNKGVWVPDFGTICYLLMHGANGNLESKPSLSADDQDPISPKLLANHCISEADTPGRVDKDLYNRMSNVFEILQQMEYAVKKNDDTPRINLQNMYLHGQFLALMELCRRNYCTNIKKESLSSNSNNNSKDNNNDVTATNEGMIDEIMNKWNKDEIKVSEKNTFYIKGWPHTYAIAAKRKQKARDIWEMFHGEHAKKDSKIDANVIVKASTKFRRLYVKNYIVKQIEEKMKDLEDIVNSDVTLLLLRMPKRAFSRCQDFLLDAFVKKAIRSINSSIAPIKTLGPYPGKMIDRLAKADDSNFCGF